MIVGVAPAAIKAQIYTQNYGRDPDATQLRNTKRSLENGANFNDVHW